jgi:hypothetical protein
MRTKDIHQIRLTAAKINRKQQKPHGNYDHSPFQVGFVEAVYPTGNFLLDPPRPIGSIDVYPNGAQNTGNSDNLILAVKTFPWYVPAVGDCVIMLRGHGRSRSSRYALGKPNGSASPYPTPLGGIDANSRFNAHLLSAWGAIAVPSNSMGANGDWCLSQNGHIYFKSSGAWSVKV